MSKLWIALLLMVFGVGVIGCEVDGDLDGDGGKLEVDIDD
jgi:hypothetical protein